MIIFDFKVFLLLFLRIKRPPNDFTKPTVYFPNTVFLLVLFIVVCLPEFSIAAIRDTPDSNFNPEFISRWNTELPGSNNDQVTIPTNGSYVYDYTVDWGDGTSDTNITGNITHTYDDPGIYTIEITGLFPAIYFNNTGDRRKIIEITSWGDIQWQSMENAFYGCENLNFDAIAAPNLSQVTTLKNMFRGAFVFNGILNGWDVSNVTDISGMF